MGRVYDDAAQFDDLFTRLFAQIDDTSGEDMKLLVETGIVVCFDVREPQVEMWVDGRTSPVRPTFGPSDLEPTLEASLSGDDLHGLLLGTLPLGKALFWRKLKVKGSKLEAMKLESLFHVLQASYPAVADEILGAR
jgi:putative sterol carrier protein